MIWGNKNVRVKFGDMPPYWPPMVRKIGLLFAVVMPMFVLAAVSGHQKPSVFLSFEESWLLSFLTYTIMAIEFLFFGAATLLVMRGRPFGLFMLFAGFTYFGMMLSAFFVSAIVLHSWPVLMLTILLSAWSLLRLRNIDASIGEREIETISDHIFIRQNGEHLLIYGEEAGHYQLKLVLRGKSSVPATAIEFVGACLVVVLGAGLVPLAVAGSFRGSGTVGWMVWSLTVVIFLAARSSVNTWILRLRAIGAVQSFGRVSPAEDKP